MVNNCLLMTFPSGQRTGSSAIPFHQLQAITDHIAWQMFSDAHRVLPQGRTLIVGNRHLDYHNKLKRSVWQRTSRCVEQQIRYFENHQTLKIKLKETHDEKVTLAAGRSGIRRLCYHWPESALLNPQIIPSTSSTTPANASPWKGWTSVKPPMFLHQEKEKAPVLRTAVSSLNSLLAEKLAEGLQ